MLKYRMHPAAIAGLVVAVALMVGACVAPVAPAPAQSGGAATASEASEAGATGAADSGDTITITHPQGETVVPKNPQRVVVFDYSALDTLDQLGVPVIAVPKETLPPFLEKYRGDEYANAGSLFEPDYELINSLKPDLILTGARTAEAYPELAEIAPTVSVTVDTANFLESSEEQLTNLGLIFDKEAEVAERLAAIDAAVAEVKELAATNGRNALIIMTSGGEITAFGPGSRFGIIHTALDVPPVVEDIEAATHGDAISFEFVLEHNPDILFVIDRDSAIGQGTEGAKAVLDNELIQQTKAYADNRIVYLDPVTWYLASSGISTLPAMIEEIRAAVE